MYKSIVVACPANISTGGPELLHQLCYELRIIGYDSFMYYYEYDSKSNSSPVPAEYTYLKNTYTTTFVDSNETILVIPETKTKLLRTARKSLKIFWWLSVDFFYTAVAGKLNPLVEKLHMDKSTILKLKNTMGIVPTLNSSRIIHMAQSHYAMEHCKTIGIDLARIYYLSDYLNPFFIENAEKNGAVIKEDIVLYNPKKGYSFTRRLMESTPDLRWVPLINLSREDMSDLLKKAKVYIDFGEHPGKDRIPREAAISGCCVITGMKGSAFFQEDVPIPEEFKFNDQAASIEGIIFKIKDIFLHYAENNEKFVAYRSAIKQEEEKFKQDVKMIFDKLMKAQG